VWEEGLHVAPDDGNHVFELCEHECLVALPDGTVVQQLLESQQFWGGLESQLAHFQALLLGDVGQEGVVAELLQVEHSAVDVLFLLSLFRELCIVECPLDLIQGAGHVLDDEWRQCGSHLAFGPA